MKYYIVTLVLAAVFAACESSDSGKEKLLSDITYLEQEIGAEARPSPEKLDTLMMKMESFAEAFPKDSLAASFLASAAEIARLHGKFDKALEHYDQILKKYADTKQAPRAMFMKAFTLDNDLKRSDEAKPLFEEFLAKYPNDEFADDAKFLLNNLGKTEEEIIKQFEAGQGGN